MAVLGTGVVSTSFSPPQSLMQKMFKLVLGGGGTIKAVITGKKAVTFFWK